MLEFLRKMVVARPATGRFNPRGTLREMILGREGRMAVSDGTAVVEYGDGRTTSQRKDGLK